MALITVFSSLASLWGVPHFADVASGPFGGFRQPAGIFYFSFCDVEKRRASSVLFTPRLSFHPTYIHIHKKEAGGILSFSEKFWNKKINRGKFDRIIYNFSKKKKNYPLSFFCLDGNHQIGLLPVKEKEIHHIFFPAFSRRLFPRSRKLNRLFSSTFCQKSLLKYPTAISQHGLF